MSDSTAPAEGPPPIPPWDPRPLLLVVGALVISLLFFFFSPVEEPPKIEAISLPIPARSPIPTKAVPPTPAIKPPPTSTATPVKKPQSPAPATKSPAR